MASTASLSRCLGAWLKVWRPPWLRRALRLRSMLRSPLAQTMRAPAAFGAARPQPSGRASLVVMNMRINNVEIPNSKRIETSLQYIFGIGETTAKIILHDSGVENKKTYELAEEDISKIRTEVEKYTTEADLRRVVSQNIKRLKDIGSYRGRRHILGLPVNGQRTKTNARTRKGKVKTVANKKKITK